MRADGQADFAAKLSTPDEKATGRNGGCENYPIGLRLQAGSTAAIAAVEARPKQNVGSTR
jgi:hypothetical protein